MGDNLPAPLPEDQDQKNTSLSSWIPDWARDLKHVPGALTSIGKLITGTTKASTSWIDIGTAQNEAEAQAIRDKTEAKSALTKAAVKVAVRQMSKDPDVAERLLERVLAEGESAQRAREDIGIKALGFIQQDPPETPPQGEPSDEWLKRFGLYAEQATSEMMRAHWAHILSHEIKAPGKFSFAALHLASLLDKTLAETVERVAKTIIRDESTKYGCVPLVPGYNTDSPRYDDLMDLDGIGFLTLSNSAEIFNYDDEGKLRLTVAKTDLEVKWAPNTVLNISAAILTRAGSELINALEFDADPHFVDCLKNALAGSFVPNFDKQPPAWSPPQTMPQPQDQPQIEAPKVD